MAKPRKHLTTASEELLHRTASDGNAAFLAASGQAVPQSRALVSVDNAAVTDELMDSGPAFGQFVEKVGLAIANSQKALDENMVKTAEALSQQTIKVVNVFEQLIDDDGKMTAGITHTEDLPLINYLMPTAYRFKEVYLTMDVNVSEFNAAQGFKLQARSSSTSASAGGGYGRGRWGFSASAGYSSSSTSVSGESGYSQDYAAGRMHMEVTLEPRSDVTTPRPFIVQRAPDLTVTIVAITDVTTTSGNPPTTTVTARQAILKAVLLSKDGGPNSGKTLSIVSNEPSLSISQTDANGNPISNPVTDSAGAAYFKIIRSGSATAFVTADVRLNLGLVSRTISLTL